MDNITEYMMRQLKSVGFSYPDYEHHLNYGMLYAWKGLTYRIGGYEDRGFSVTDKQAAAEGLWLPDGSQLLDWLKNCGFSVAIQLDSEESYFHVSAVDPTSNRQYSGGGLLLSHALHKVIYKVCKSGGRYCPEPVLRLNINPAEC